MHIDHLGVATRDADEAAALLGQLLSAPVAHEETSAELRFVFLALENGAVELLEPLGEDNPVADFLDDRGPGIHHLAVRVEDVVAALDSARVAGFDLVDQEPRPGARGDEIAFVHPRSTGGVLVEFVG